MADMEKVIKGLEILMNGCEYIHCDDCCFYISTKPTRCGLREEQIQKDALALLKEQEQTISNLNETGKNLLQQIIDIKEYMTPYGKVKDVKAVDGLLKEQEAKWVEDKQGEHCRLIKCSNCGLTFIVGNNIPYDEWIEDRNYCRRCGARMVKRND